MYCSVLTNFIMEIVVRELCCRMRAKTVITVGLKHMLERLASARVLKKL